MSYRINLRLDTEVALEEAFVDLRKEKRLAGALVRPAEEKREDLVIAPRRWGWHPGTAAGACRSQRFQATVTAYGR